MKCSASAAARPRLEGSRKRRPYLLALVSLLVCLAFYTLAVLRVDFRKTQLLDLDPTPDAVEYFAGAVSLYQRGNYAIRIGDQDLPPRYPPGYSLAMLPFIGLLGENAILAPFRVNQLLGLVLIIALFCYFYRSRRPLLAAVAVAVLVTLPGFILFARSSMSELLGAALILAAYYCCVRGLRDRNLLFFPVAGFTLGAAALVRYQLLLFSPLLLSVFFVGGFSKSRRLLTFLLSGLSLTLVVIPMMLYNWVEFGSPALTGYDFWVPDQAAAGRAFGLRFLATQLHLLWEEFSLTVRGSRAAYVFGLGYYYSPAFLLLCGLAIVWSIRTEKHRILLLPAALFVGGMLFYFWEDPRLYFAAAILAVPLIALFLGAVFGGRPTMTPLGWRLALVCLLVCALAGFPSRGGFPYSQTWALLGMDRLGARSPKYELVQSWRDHFGQASSLVISSMNPAYVSSLLGPGSIAVPQDQNNEYSLGRRIRYGKQSAMQAIGDAIGEARRVYYLTPDPSSEETVRALLPPPEGFDWEQRPDVAAAGMTYEMLPVR
jgi:4-amino-4-deoxy-L-arabinose transferase-like glycosyltransferase